MMPTLQEEKTYSLLMKDFPYNPGMDSVRELIVKVLEERGESLSSMSKKLGRNHAYLQQFVHRGVPQKLPEDVRIRLASLAGLQEGQLILPGQVARARPIPPQNAVLGGPISLSGMIPLYGQAVAGDDGEFILNGNRIRDILAPPDLAGVENAYAVAVVGTSMEPRYFAGERVFVNPRAPVRRGDFVVAQIAGDEGDPPHAYVKQFVSKEARVLRLNQFNPKKMLTFPVQKVVSIHRIVMGGD